MQSEQHANTTQQSQINMLQQPSEVALVVIELEISDCTTIKSWSVVCETALAALVR